LTAIIDDAKSLADYKRSYRAKKWGLSKYKPDVTVNIKYLTQALCIPDLEEKCSSVPPLYDIAEEKLFTPCIKGAGGQGCRGAGGKEFIQKLSSAPLPLCPPSPKKSFRFPKKGLVVLWSDMGTGKTELMRWWRDQNPDARFLNNGHRVNLLKNLAER
ncbi:MAG: bifunctional DNA primase/helicase, partial [Nostoc sp.]